MCRGRAIDRPSLSHVAIACGLTDGRERRRGTWWDRHNQCVAEEGVDFAQDTQEGGADEFDFIPDSEEVFCGGCDIVKVLGVDGMEESKVPSVGAMEESIGGETG